MNEKVYERSNDYRQQFFKANKPLFGKNIYQCAYCGKLKRRKSITVDHVIPINKVKRRGFGRFLMRISGISDINDTKNLVAACGKCNRKKTDKIGLWPLRGLIGKHFVCWLIVWIFFAILFCVVFVYLSPYISKFFQICAQSVADTNSASST